MKFIHLNMKHCFSPVLELIPILHYIVFYTACKLMKMLISTQYKKTETLVLLKIIQCQGLMSNDIQMSNDIHINDHALQLFNSNQIGKLS